MTAHFWQLSMQEEFADFDLQEWNSLSNNRYTFLNTISFGANAIVIKVLDTKNNEQCACKVIHRYKLDGTSNIKMIEQETRVSSVLNNSNIIHCRDILYAPTFIGIVMDYCPFDLLSYVQDENNSCGSLIYRLFAHILEGMIYLHSKGIAHCDLKLENIFVSPNGTIKIGDFGSCINVDIPSNQYLPYYGSNLFAPPEMETNNGKDFDPMKADIWAIGVLFYALFTKQYPFPDDIPASEKATAFDRQIEQLKNNRTIYQILKMCSVTDPKLRPSFVQIRNLLLNNQKEVNQTASKSSLPTRIRQRVVAARIGSIKRSLQRDIRWSNPY